MLMSFLLHCIIENMKRPRLLDQRTRLTAAAKADISWWLLFTENWNGIGFFPAAENAPHSEVIISDASGSWGCGAFSPTSSQFFQLEWPSSWKDVHISAKELLPVVVSSALWGSSWAGKRILFRCDNMAAVHALNNRSARDPSLTYLLQCLFFFEAHFQFEHIASHIRGRENIAADALSRNQLSHFLSLVPQALHPPTQVPPPLQELLSHPSPSWTSAHWRDLFKATLRAVSPSELKPHMCQARSAT